MTRDQNRYGIRTDRGTRRARRIGLADSARQFAIRKRLAGGNRAKPIPYGALKWSADDVEMAE